jgi:hypothetical protein
MSLVWATDLPPNEGLVLFAYADHADHEGGNIWPAVAAALGLENMRSRFPNYSSPVSAWEGIRVRPQPVQEPGRNGGADQVTASTLRAPALLLPEFRTLVTPAVPPSRGVTAIS